jgi:radical SAM superfamily enzyme YgiQ (UPF0313 family)
MRIVNGLASVPELNVIKKDWRKADLKIGLCYPNVYRAGMTGLTVRLLYALFNAREDVVCERFFVPTLREPWTSLESNQSLRRFDVAAFTLQYEEDYLNVMRMLMSSGIPPRRDNRTTEHPLVIAGGPCATSNPEPLADYVDLFVIGEAEPILDSLVEELKACKQPHRHIDGFADIPGVYVPEISNPTRRVWVRNLDDALHSVAQQVPLGGHGSPYMTVFGPSLDVEVSRGCGRRCRFCLLRHISLPKRERSLGRVEEIVEEGVKWTPVGKVSLIGASLFNYSRLEDACEFIVSHGHNLSIASISPESVTERLAKLLAKGNQRNVTVAPDAASPRMRDVICKEMDEEKLLDAAHVLLSQGINRLKLYFIVGLPGETVEDVKAIADLAKMVADAGYGLKAVHLSINPLIPKPHTPFQWEKAPPVKYVRESLSLLRKLLRSDRRFIIDSMDPRHTQIQAFLSLGDRKVGRVTELAAGYGGGLGAWRRAMKGTGVRLESYTQGIDLENRLPWDHINVGVNKKYLKREVEDYKTDVLHRR